MTQLQNIPIVRWPRGYSLAIDRCADLRETWLSRPENYPPPRWAPREAIDAHQRRWLASVEKAHCDMILRGEDA
jgi:hypothetical protein